MSECGKYVVIEGHDGTGKTTQIEKIIDRLAVHGFESIKLSEPADEDDEDILIAAAIRKIIKNGDLERDPMTNLMLFSATRHELWHKKALPALKAGKWVVAARNYYSTEAYQGYGEGVGLDTISSTTRLATDDQYMSPDIAVILNMDDEEERMRRIAGRGELENPDTFESKDSDFQSRVKDAYVQIATKHDIPVVSAVGSIEEVTDRIWTHIKPHIAML